MEYIKIELSKRQYGGRMYEKQIIELLGCEIKFKRFYLLKHKMKFLNFYRFIYFFIKYRYFYKGNLLLTNQTTWLAGKKASRNIIVIHHIDEGFQRRSFTDFFDSFCLSFFQINKLLYTQIITVSQYWKEELQRRSFKNVSVIYNSFNPDNYKINKSDINHFKKKYKLDDKPIVYLGNAQKKKGVVDAYEQLKDLECHLISSGQNQLNIPVQNLDLNNSEYILMLAAADVVISMSKFKEGWSRTTHEAILCGTPVIGSGLGGMKELLELANQTICSSFDELKFHVNKVLTNELTYMPNDKIIEFNEKYFKSKWLEVLK